MAAKNHFQPRALSRTRAPFSIRYAAQVLEKNGNVVHGAVTAVEARHAIAMPSLHAVTKSVHEADRVERPQVAQVPAEASQRKEVNREVANRKALIRLMKSPDWLVTAQRMNRYKPERMLTKIINAMNALVDIIRRLELVERQLMDLPFSSEYEQQHATQLSKALLSRWQELGEAVLCFDVESHRALYMVRHSSLEMADVVHDVRELLRLEPPPDTERLSVSSVSVNSIIPKSSLSPQAYRAYAALQPVLIEISRAIDAVHGRLETLDRHIPVLRGDGIRRRKAVVAFPAQWASAAGNTASGQRLLKKSPRDAFVKLGKPTSLICETVQDLCRDLQEAGVLDIELLEGLAKCADRLSSILPEDPAKKWETQLHRGRHWFMMANVKIQALNGNAISNISSTSAAALLAEKAKIAQYVIESFVNVINIALELADGRGMKPNLRQATRKQGSIPATARPTVRWRPGAEILKGPQSVAASPRVAPRLSVGAHVAEGPPAKPAVLFEGQGQRYKSVSIAQNSAQTAKALARRPKEGVTASGNTRSANPFLKTREMVSYYSELERRASLNPNT